MGCDICVLAPSEAGCDKRQQWTTEGRVGMKEEKTEAWEDARPKCPYVVAVKCGAATRRNEAVKGVRVLRTSLVSGLPRCGTA